MKPLLKSHRNVDWHIAAPDDSVTTEFLDKLSAFLVEHKVQRKKTKPKCKKKKDKKDKNEPSVKKEQKDKTSKGADRNRQSKKDDKSVSVKKEDADCNDGKEGSRNLEASPTKDWPVCLGLRSVLRGLDKDDHLAMAVIDADALLPPAIGQFVGLFAASGKTPVYAVRGLSDRLAKQTKLNSLHAIGFLKSLPCESIASTTAQLLRPVSVADGDEATDEKKQTPSDQRKRKFIPATAITPVASSSKKKRRRK